MKALFVGCVSLLGLSSPCLGQMDFGLSTELSTREGHSSGEPIASQQACDTILCGQGVSPSAKSYSLSDLLNLGVFEGKQVPEAQPIKPALPRLQQPVGPLGQELLRQQASLPSVDVEVFFKLGSYELEGQQNRALAAVASKLSRISGEGYSLAVLGHTDKRGTHAFNQALSDQRAQTVKRFLEPFLDSNAEVYTKGMSYDALKNSLDPYASENRRVQIILIPSGAVASQSPK